MALIIDLVLNNPINEKNFNDCKDSLDIKNITVMLTDDLFDVLEIIDINMDEVDCDSKLEKINYIFEKSDVVISHKCDLKINILKHLFTQKNIHENLLDYKRNMCLMTLSKDIVKKVNRHGLVNPDINDITLKLFDEQFVDIQNSKYTCFTLQRICKKLHEDNKLNIKASFLNKLTKSFKLMVAHSQKIPQLHYQLGKSLRLEP